MRAVGVISSIIGTYLVKTSEEARAAMKAIHLGFTVSALSSQFLESRSLFWGSVPFHFGLLPKCFA